MSLVPVKQKANPAWLLGGFVFILASGFTLRSLMDDSFRLPAALQDFFTLSFSVIIESTPFVIFGIVLAALLQAFIRQDMLLKRLPKNGFLRRAVLSLCGVVLPVCECGNMPLARGLMLKGLSVGDATTFLLAAPIVNPLVIITTQQAFGWDNGILALRLIGGFVIANLVGWLLSQHAKPESLLTDKFSAACSHNHDHVAGKGKVREVSSSFLNELNAMMPALIIGSAIAGAIQVLVPREALLAVGQNIFLSIIAMVVLGMVVAICSNVDAFFALSFASSFLPGSILVFLLVGPLVDVKMITLMRTTYKSRTIAIIVTVVILTASVIGLAVNTFA